MTPEKHIKALELDKIKALLAGFATSERSKEKALNIQPSDDYNTVCRLINDTAQINSLTIRHGTPGLGGIHDMTEAVNKAAVGGRMSIKELLSVGRVLKVIRSVKSWYENTEEHIDCEEMFTMLVTYRNIEDELTRCILNEDELNDNASPALNEIRTKMRRAQAKIREQLNDIIHSQFYSKILQESIITQRDGRFVVPVKSECRNELNGLIHGTSSSGATVFIEPAAVVEANNQIRILENEEQQEVDRILYELSAAIGSCASSINSSFDLVTDIDVIFAKSKLADSMRATVPVISKDKIIKLKKARHPLIDKTKVVPIDITLGETYDTLVITGPNTGGKTVALKTLGLMSLMAACGMLLPCGENSQIAVFDNVLADIGDEQSIEQSLSTFSAHIKNIISILDKANDNSLVLVDELGAGTDPIEGAALAISIIEKLREKGSIVAATTHYAEIKMYALTTEGVENGSCEFDVNTLSPTYRLLVGIPGKSNAFAISHRLGLDDDVIDRAKELVSSENIRFEDVVDQLERTRKELEEEKLLASSNRKRTELLKAEIEEEKKRLNKQMEDELNAARSEAQTIVERVKSHTDQLLNELETLKKEKDKESFSKNVANIRGNYGGRIEKLRDMADPVTKSNHAPVENSREIKSGDSVIIADINAEGVVISGPDKNGNYLVQAGIIKTKVKKDNLRLVENKQKVKYNNKNLVSVRSQKADKSVKTELDIRGLASDEGIIELKKFIDRCLMMNIPSATIIHGKGTGVLRAAVQQHLKKEKRVRSFRPGVYGEGEAGVTIVEFK